jgi:aminoglycoside phosphotransferase (APT) family kinase protein
MVVRSLGADESERTRRTHKRRILLVSDSAASGAAVLVPVLANHRVDEAKLIAYLAKHIPEFARGAEIKQFQGGFSNPTFHLQTPAAAFVLRKKPPGVLLPSAHAVEREYAVMKALADTDVPVPRMRLLCEDPEIIGTTFYVMEFVAGRVYTDRLLPGCTPGQRREMYDAMNDVLARLHRVDYRSVGLSDFGKPTGYVSRQVARWSKQYLASATEDVPAMNELMQWLPAHMPKEDEATIAHGDYRIGNLLFHPTESRVVAVLDWELSTIGHPLGDLAYCCSAYHLPSAGGRGFSEVGLRGLGIPGEAEFLESYRRRVGRADIPHWTFFIVFSLFRSAGILAGVYRRSVDGQGVDARMAEAKKSYQDIAQRAWAIAQASPGVLQD